MKSKRLLIYILSFISSFLLVGAIATATQADSTTVHQQNPSILLGKYWQTTVKSTPNNSVYHEYFYATKDGFVLKHTKYGNLRAKWMMYTHTNGIYILNGANSSNVAKTIWIFITPNSNWRKIRIGYTITNIKNEPKHFPQYYQHETAVRTSKVTAILH